MKKYKYLEIATLYTLVYLVLHICFKEFKNKTHKYGLYAMSLKGDSLSHSNMLILNTT